MPISRCGLQSCCSIDPEEIGHDFCGMCILLSRNVLFLLTQRVDLGCMGVHCSLWMHSNILESVTNFLWHRSIVAHAMHDGHNQWVWSLV